MIFAVLDDFQEVIFVEGGAAMVAIEADVRRSVAAFRHCTLKSGHASQAKIIYNEAKATKQSLPFTIVSPNFH